MKKLILIMLLFAGACHKKELKENVIIYKNDFESLLGWVPLEPDKLAKGIAHSGDYSALTDSTHPYSISFIRKLKDISDQRIKKTELDVWVLSKSLDAKASLVFSIESEGKAAFYRGVNVIDSIEATNKWYRVKCQYNLPADLNPENEVRIYLWNTGKDAVLADDFELKFYN